MVGGVVLELDEEVDVAWGSLSPHGGAEKAEASNAAAREFVPVGGQ